MPFVFGAYGSSGPDLATRGTWGPDSGGSTSPSDSSAQWPASQRQWIAKIVELGNRPAQTSQDGHYSGSTDEWNPASKQKARCPLCNIELLKRTLPRHIRTTHVAQGAHVCSTCDLVFARKDSFERHWREQHSESKVRCRTCGALVGYRALKGHRQTQKCRDARRPSESSFSDDRYDNVSTRVCRQPNHMLLMDPIVVIASFHRLVLAAWLESSPYFTSTDFTDTVSVRFGPGEKGRASNIVEGPKIPQIGMNLTIPAHAWMLRSLALAQTREMLSKKRNRTTYSDDLQSIDDGLIRVMLLNSADQVLFGQNSAECQSHNAGLVSLLESVQPTGQFRTRFEQLLEYAWRAIGGQDGSMARYHEKPLIALLNYKSLLDYKFWYDPVPGCWVVYDLHATKENRKGTGTEPVATHGEEGKSLDLTC